MKKSLLILTTLFLVQNFLAQSPPPSFKTTQLKNNYSSFSARKQTIIQKQTEKVGIFKDLEIQKITLTDLTDQSTHTVVGLMTFQETFDQISKNTTILEGDELKGFISALETLASRGQPKTNTELKLKYITQKGIVVGSNYSSTEKAWTYYLQLPRSAFAQRAIVFDVKDLGDLISLLKKAEKAI